MAIIDVQVQSYYVWLSRKLSTRPEEDVARVRCRGGDGHNVFITFIAATGTLPANEYDAVNKYAKIYRPSSEYAWYLDLLRNEQPVTARIYTPPHDPANHYIYAGPEPVGEGE